MCLFPCLLYVSMSSCGQKIHYIPIPKTGSESTKNMLGSFACWKRPGTHKMNLGLHKIEHVWMNSTVIRIATFRDPVERFVSTYTALRNSKLTRSDQDYIPLISKDINSLVNNFTAMKLLMNGMGSGHFIPIFKFLLTKNCLTSHFIVNFTYINEFTHLVTDVFETNLTLKRVNDPIPGLHNYYKSEYVSFHIKKYYREDFLLHRKLHTICDHSYHHILVCKPQCNILPEKLY